MKIPRKNIQGGPKIEPQTQTFTEKTKELVSKLQTGNRLGVSPQGFYE